MKQCYLNTLSPGMANHGILLSAKQSQSYSLLCSDFFVSQNALAATTAGSVQQQTPVTRNWNDPLVATIAKILLPRIQNTCVQWNNEEMVDMLIEEWNDFPSCGCEIEHECLLQLLACHSQRLQKSIPNDSHSRNIVFSHSVWSYLSAHAFRVNANGILKEKLKWLSLIGNPNALLGMIRNIK